MARYISQVFIVVEAKDASEACDAMTACLSETLKYDGHIVDWSYAAGDQAGRYDSPKLLAAPFQTGDIEDENFDDLNRSADRSQVIAA